MNALFPLLQEALGAGNEVAAPAPDVVAMLAAAEVPDLVYHSFEPAPPTAFPVAAGIGPHPFGRPAATEAVPAGEPDPAGPPHRVRLVHTLDPAADPPPRGSPPPPPPPAPAPAANGSVPASPFPGPAAAAPFGAARPAGREVPGERNETGREADRRSPRSWRATSLAEVFRRLDDRAPGARAPARSLRDVFQADPGRRPPGGGSFSLVPPR